MELLSYEFEAKWSKNFLTQQITCKQKATNTLYARPQGLAYDPLARAELFADSLVNQFTCLPRASKSDIEVNKAVKSLETLVDKHLSPITLGEIKNIIKKQPNNKAPGLDNIPNKAIKHFSQRTLLHLKKCIILVYGYTTSRILEKRRLLSWFPNLARI